MATYRPDAPLIVQSDGTILAETAAPGYPDARARLARFAELEKSPEHVHTYRVTPLSLWNAAAAGMSAEEIERALADHSKYDTTSPADQCAARPPASAAARRAPRATGLDTKKKIVAKYGENATFEKGKSLPKVA